MVSVPLAESEARYAPLAVHGSACPGQMSRRGMMSGGMYGGGMYGGGMGGMYGGGMGSMYGGGMY
jgi:hypothetical protein